MKNIFLQFSILCLWFPNSLIAQITAGSVPEGYTLHQSDFKISVDRFDFIALDEIDINADGEKDLRFNIRKGEEMFLENRASVAAIHDDITICHTHSLNYTPSKLYNENETMECKDSTKFELDPGLVAYGLGRSPFNPQFPFPTMANEEYLHYKYENDTELYDSHEAAQCYINSSVEEYADMDDKNFFERISSTTIGLTS